MTKNEACKLENKCDELMTEAIQINCTVSLTLTGKLKISFENNMITFRTDNYEVDYIRYKGFYSDLQSICLAAQTCFQKNYKIFEQLVWSYEHIKELD